MTINLKKSFILIIILFFGFLHAFADGSYKNELTKVSLSPVGASDVKVTLYMAKPYTEPLRLLKKNDGEFVLILPETFNSAPQKPSISDVIGEVTDADIKLYSFVSNSAQNGYTKIVIKTNGLVNLYPEAVTVGGGHATKKPKEEINKIISEQVGVVKNNAVSQNPVQVQKSQQKEASENKKTDLENQNAKKQAKAEVEEKQKNENNVLPIVADATPVAELPKIEDIIVDSTDDVILNEVSAGNNYNAENNTPERVETQSIWALIKNKLELITPSIKEKVFNLDSETSGNILVLLVSVLLVGFSLKFGLAVIKNAKPKKEDPFDNLTFDKNQTKNDSSPEYSKFFKTLIDSESKGNNPFSIETTPTSPSVGFTHEYRKKSHEETLNEDQNLSWQEKFRALQKNKKSLLKTKPETQVQTDLSTDMHIENPIKKLQQDFKAVRKVLERQRGKNGASSSQSGDFVPEKMEQIEVISFEDFQQNVERPKVQINKTSPIKAKAPKVLTQLQLGDQKGLYLVDYKDKVSLIGYINDKVFKLSSYSSVKDAKMYARLSEKNKNVETYIVKFDDNKMLVDVDNAGMKLKLTY